jgi:hypothetical protein
VSTEEAAPRERPSFFAEARSGICVLQADRKMKETARELLELSTKHARQQMETITEEAREIA